MSVVDIAACIIGACGGAALVQVISSQIRWFVYKKSRNLNYWSWSHKKAVVAKQDEPKLFDTDAIADFKALATRTTRWPEERKLNHRKELRLAELILEAEYFTVRDKFAGFVFPEIEMVEELSKIEDNEPPAYISEFSDDAYAFNRKVVKYHKYKIKDPVEIQTELVARKRKQMVGTNMKEDELGYATQWIDERECGAMRMSTPGLIEMAYEVERGLR